VRLEKEGFQPWESVLSLKAGGAETISATLEPVETAPPEPAPPEVQEGDLVERGAGVIDPKCIQCPGPRYPEAAKRTKLQGTVEISFIVTETGEVQEIQIRESAGDIFDQAVIEAVKGWKFEPATKNGVPVKVRMPPRRFRFEHR
jgi:TonB family protein